MKVLGLFKVCDLLQTDFVPNIYKQLFFLFICLFACLETYVSKTWTKQVSDGHIGSLNT